MPHLIKEEALFRAKERAASAGAEADSFMEDFLELSARTDSLGRTHYATFLTAAVYLEQSPQFQLLSEAENGVKFTQMKDAIASLRSLQAAYDAANMLFIPAGMEATIQVKTISSPLFSTQVLRTVAVP